MRRRHLAVGGIALVLLLALGVLAVRLSSQAGPITRVVTLGAGENPGTMVIDAYSGHGFLSLYTDRANINQLLMLNTVTGSLLRTISLPNQPTTLAIDARRSRLFAAGGIGSSWYSSIVDTRSGRRLKTIALPHPNFGAMVADEATGRIFASTSDAAGNGNVIVLDGRSGRLLRTLPISGNPDADSMTIGGSPARIIVTGYSNSSPTRTTVVIQILDPVTGRRLRNYAVHLGSWGYTEVDPALQRAYIFTSPNHFFPTFPAGSGQSGGNVNAGTIRIVDLGHNIASHIIRLRQRPLNATVDEQTGRTFITVAGPVRAFTQVTRSSSGAIAGAWTSLIPLDRGTVLVLDSHSDHVVGRSAVGVAPEGGVVVDSGRRLLIVNGGQTDDKGAPKGSISVSLLDGRSGVVLRTISLNMVSYGVGLVADNRSGHVFALAPGGTSTVVDVWGWVPGWLRRWLPFLPHPTPPRPAGGRIFMLDTSRL